MRNMDSHSLVDNKNLHSKGCRLEHRLNETFLFLYDGIAYGEVSANMPSLVEPLAHDMPVLRTEQYFFTFETD